MLASDKQLSDEQSRQVAATIREELARRRISRQQLAEHAKISISTLEKALGRPPAVHARDHGPAGGGARRLAAQGHERRPRPRRPPTATSRPTSLGAYSRRAVTWIEGNYVTLRPSFGDKDAIYAYRTEIAWDAKALEPAVPREPSGSTRRSPSSARSRCRTSRATSISSPTGTASTG